MRTFGLHALTNTAAAGIGDNLLARSGCVAASPSGSSSAYILAFPTLLAQARAAQAKLVAALAAFASATTAHEKKVALALAEEKALDAACSPLRARLLAEIKSGDADSRDLDALLFPAGLVPITKPSGRPQLAIYQALVHRLSEPSATSNPAYALIAGSAADFIPQVEAFALTIQQKDDLDGAATAARNARDQAQAEWTPAFRELIAAAAHIHGEESETFLAWIRPLLDWKAAQAAAQTRRANAQEAPAPAEPAPVTETPTDDDQGDA